MNHGQDVYYISQINFRTKQCTNVQRGLYDIYIDEMYMEYIYRISYIPLEMMLLVYTHYIRGQASPPQRGSVYINLNVTTEEGYILVVNNV